MLYPMPFGTDEPLEERRKRLRGNMLGNPDPVIGTAEYLMGIAATPQHAATPEPATLSGSSAIGLTPEQTSRVLDRLQQDNQFQQRLAADQNARRDQHIEGLNRTVFRAREMEQRRRDMLAQQERQAELQQQQMQQPRYFPGPGGMITELTPGMEGQPAQTRTIQEAQQPQPSLQAIRTVDAQGNPVVRYDIPQAGQEFAVPQQPQTPPNMQDDRYTVMENGVPNIYRDVIDPKTGKVVERQFLGQGQAPSQPATGLTPYQQQAIKDNARKWVDEQVQSLSKSQENRQFLGDYLYRAGVELPFIQNYLDTYFKVDNYLGWGLGEQVPYAPSPGLQTPAAGQGEAPQAPQTPQPPEGLPQPSLPAGVPQGSRRVLYDGKPGWETPDGKVILD